MSDGKIRVTAITAFTDNYIWLIDNGAYGIVVDPGDAAPVEAFLEKESLSLAAILLTHKHDDHIGGVSVLRQKYDVPVYGPANDGISVVTTFLKEGDTVQVASMQGLSLSVLEVPGHTTGHIAYVEPKQHWLFCGDMLFGAGCGRLFEGTPETMVASLDKMAALPDDTLVFAGHEYTLSNLRFAREIEPDNIAILKRMQADKLKLEQGKPTLPSTLKLEKETNPFLRNREASVMDRLQTIQRIKNRDPVEAFAAMREWKNTYR